MAVLLMAGLLVSCGEVEAVRQQRQQHEHTRLLKLDALIVADQYFAI
jgi:hypothetical protein